MTVSLILGSHETLAAEDQGGTALATLLGLPAPGSWPPDGNDAATRDWMRGLLTAHPADARFICHYIVADGALVGTCGFTGPPDDNGRVELGYGVIASAQRRGYASAAVAQLIAIAFADPRVSVIAAETLADAIPSQKVLTRCGFTIAGARDDAENGAVTVFQHSR
jgi:[ribosomal protein S5]-alanine N-acetyltransferase